MFEFQCPPSPFFLHQPKELTEKDHELFNSIVETTGDVNVAAALLFAFAYSLPEALPPKDKDAHF